MQATSSNSLSIIMLISEHITPHRSEGNSSLCPELCSPLGSSAHREEYTPKQHPGNCKEITFDVKHFQLTNQIKVFGSGLKQNSPFYFLIVKV